MKDALLVLADGTVFEGKSFGKIGTATGELCFTTGMTGYQEELTDPSFYGQVLIMNNVHVGNYGVCKKDEESNGVKVKAIIGRNLEDNYSRAAADASLQQYLEGHHIVGIEGLDTRALVIHVRNSGALNCIVSSEIKEVDKLKAMLADTPSMKGLELASFVSTKETYALGSESASFRVAVLDLGVKRSILKCLTERDVYLKVFNARTSFAEMETFNPDGYFISNGPGDPEPMDYAIKTVKDILASGKPMFGICLGHQLLALANGIHTFKMHHGHRGVNHPVKNVITETCEITTQNHGFGIDLDSVRNNAAVEITHINLNDGSVEGIRMKDRPVFSVQYHPEASPGPHDSRYLFDHFIKLMHNHP